MNQNTEQSICGTFFDKKFADRLYYELSSPKKRDGFFRKMSHTAENYLGKCIADSFKMPPEKGRITEFLEDGICYFIAGNSEFDGRLCTLSEALNELYCCGVPYMAVNRNLCRAYLETEYNFSEHRAFFLHCKNTPNRG